MPASAGTSPSIQFKSLPPADPGLGFQWLQDPLSWSLPVWACYRNFPLQLVHQKNVLKSNLHLFISFAFLLVFKTTNLIMFNLTHTNYYVHLIRCEYNLLLRNNEPCGTRFRWRFTSSYSRQIPSQHRRSGKLANESVHSLRCATLVAGFALSTL